MDPRDRDALIEAALTAWRPRSPDGRIHPHPAWVDLPPDGREAAYDAMMRARSLESLLDPDRLSTTTRTILRRIFGLAR